jgi:hypothetical protein
MTFPFGPNPKLCLGGLKIGGTKCLKVSILPIGGTPSRKAYDSEYHLTSLYSVRLVELRWESAVIQIMK